ncbi:MAG: uracil-DNA glycosylase family protein [Spirochaetota bacterium]
MKPVLAQILQTYTRRDRLLLTRSSEERERLIRWLSMPQAVAEHPAQVTKQKQLPANLSCAACPGTGKQKQPSGSGTNGFMVILNAPAMMTSFEKNDLRAESVDMIRKIIGSLGLDITECYITNMIKCEIDSVDRPSTFFKHCSLLLEQELIRVDPRVVLVMGDLTPMRKLRKQFEHSNWYEIPHPITMLKNPDIKRDAWRTLKLVISLLETM